MEAYVEAYTGRKIWLSAPVFDTAEIAHSLSFLCRFTGHCSRFYSVGEHSILVASIMHHFRLGDPLEGLMHDATESILNDINSPIKYNLLPDYRDVEAFFDRQLRAQFGLPLAKTHACDLADLAALAIEAAELLPSGGKDWSILTEEIRWMAAEYNAAHLPQLGRETFDHVRTTWLHMFETYWNRSHNAPYITG